jgi:hypothetical protein
MFKLTEEQENCISLAATGEDLLIEALSGASKSTTLREIAKSQPNKRFLYIAYNKSVATEATETFPKNTTCKTIHSIAFGAIGYKYAKRLGNLNAYIASKELHTDTKTARIAIDAVNNFCTTADEVITEEHLPDIFKDGELSHETQAKKRHWVELSNKLWAKICDVDSKLAVNHDNYLKMYGLSKPTLNYDAILFDEVQDTNGVLYGISLQQVCQKIYVGDRLQNIYSFRNTINIMSVVNVKHRGTLSCSFRFGYQVADLVNKMMADVMFTPMQTLPSKSTSIVTKNRYPFTVITRTNASIIDVVLRMHNIGKKCHVIGGADEQIAQLEAIYCIHKGGTTNYWAFKRFKDFKSLLIYSNSREGENYKAIVNYISKKLDEIPEIVKALRACVSADKADVSCVTAHSSKGAEFDNVTLYSDYPSKHDKQWSEEESRLLYVAITRAKKELNISKCDAVKSYLNG